MGSLMKMRPFLLLILLLVVEIGVKEVEGKKYLHPGLLDRCIESNHTLPGCNPKPNQPRQQANYYSHGCPKSQRCRHK